MTDSTGLRRWIVVAATLCAILILPVAWDAAQGWVWPDGVSYLDLATNALHHSPAVLVKNGYWSPLYPAILAVMMAIFQPSPDSELHAVYVLQWLTFVFAAGCFGVLAGTLLRWLRHHVAGGGGWDGAASKALICFGFSFFLLANMNPTLWFACPDTILQGIIYLSAAGALRLFVPGASWKHSAALGVVFGLGYWTKAAMFPAAFLLLGILFLRPPKDVLGRRHVLIALACFIVVAAPLVMGLSLEKHRLTFGDSGKLNYAWFVNGIPAFTAWNGQPPESGTPVHGPRRLSESPLILEFRTPVVGTLPIWSDPSYWWEGLRAPFHLDRQLKALSRPFTVVHSMQMKLLALVALLAPLCLLSFRVRNAIRGGGSQTWILLAWPVAVCLMYSLVNFSFRYTAVYFVLVCLGGAALVMQPLQNATRVRVLFVAVALLLLAGGVKLRPLVVEALSGRERGILPVEEDRDNAIGARLIAQGLPRLGIKPGDELCVLGHSLDAYYARLAGVRIVAQVWEDTDQLAGLGAPQVQQVLAQLKQLGVKALISRTAKPGFVNDSGWVPVPRTNIYVRLL